MRVDNIIMVQQVPNSHKSLKMYPPDRMRYEDMPAEILLRALCPKNSTKDWHVCQACMSGCQAGNLLVAYMTGEKIRQQPVAVPEPVKKKPGPKPSEAVKAKMAAARDAILQGRSHDEVAAEYGYKSWYTLRDAMTRLGIEPPPPTEKDKAKRMAYEKERREESIQKCMHARRLFAQGMKREDAARAVGHSCWQVVQNTYYRHRAEVDRRESL